MPQNTFIFNDLSLRTSSTERAGATTGVVVSEGKNAVYCVLAFGAVTT